MANIKWYDEYGLNYDVVQQIARGAYHDILSNKYFRKVPIEKPGILAKILQPPIYTWDLNIDRVKKEKETLAMDYAEDLERRILYNRISASSVKGSLKNLIARGKNSQLKFRTKQHDNQRNFTSALDQVVDKGESIVDILTYVRDSSTAILEVIPIPLSKGLAKFISIGGKLIENSAKYSAKRATAGLAIDIASEIVLTVIPIKGVKAEMSKKHIDAAALVVKTAFDVANTAVTKGSWSDLSLEALISLEGIAMQKTGIPPEVLKLIVKIPVKVNVGIHDPKIKSTTKPIRLTKDPKAISVGTLDLIDSAFLIYKDHR